MGQSLKKLAPAGADEKKAKEIGPIIENFYNSYSSTQNWKSDDFYRAVCETVEEINKKLNNTQFRIPKADTINQAFNNHHVKDGRVIPLSKEVFEKVLRELIVDTGFTGMGAKDILFYIFGIPVTALFIKQRIAPKIIPNEIFIPGVTSATVFLLAKLNKI